MSDWAMLTTVKLRIGNYAQSSYHVTLPFNCLTCISSFCSHPLSGIP